MKNFLPVLLGLSLFLPMTGRGDVPALPAEAYPGEHYQVIWTSSPFAVATPEGAPTSTDYQLVGVAQFEGIIYASLIDKSNQEHFLLTSRTPVRGLTLVSVSHGTGTNGSGVVVSRNGGETLNLKLETAPSGGGQVAGGPPPMPGMPTAAPQIPMPGTVANQGEAPPYPAVRRFPRPRIVRLPPPPPPPGQQNAVPPTAPGQ